MNITSKTIRVGSVNVQLFYQPGAKTPSGFECTHDNTTNESGYFRSGGLTFQGIELVDYDGVSELPKSVKVALDLEGLDASYAD